MEITQAVKRKWYKVTLFKGDYDLDEILYYLCGLGSSGTEEKDGILETYFPYQNHESAVNSLKHFLIDLGCENCFGREYIIEEENWCLNWQKGFRIIRLTDKIVICPCWLESEVEAEVKLVIKPEMAFGTGTHPTTQMALRLMEKLLKPGMSVLDAGCGSGILTIAALKMGANSVDCWDIDPNVRNNFIENINLNNILGGYNLIVGDVTFLRQLTYDLVVCNIDKKVNLRMLSVIFQSCTRPVIVFTGLLNEDREDFVSEILKLRLDFVDEISQGEWIAIVVN